jgi:hypothetical protein
MAGNIKDVRIVTFDADFGRYTKGEHAMHKSVASVIEKNKDFKGKIKNAKDVYDKKLEEIKAKKAKEESKND